MAMVLKVFDLNLVVKDLIFLVYIVTIFVVVVKIIVDYFIQKIKKHYWIDV